ncbi:MAG: HEAT repeat domain-containing protein [Christensenellales bacterium]|jgi:HEAT repeat protein
MSNLSEKNLEKLRRIQEIAEADELDEEEFKFLLKCAVDRVICVKTEAIEALYDVEDPRAIEVLLTLVNDKDDLVRTCACESLRNYDDEKVIKVLKKKAVEDESDMVRGYAITALGDIGVAYPAHKREFVEFMKENLKNESEDWVKGSYYTELCRMGEDYLSALLEGLNNASYSVRYATINSLYPVFCADNYEKIAQKCEIAFENEQESVLKIEIRKLLDTMQQELN